MHEAPRTFSDVTQTANRCLEIIGRYTPRHAATIMLKGIKTLSRTDKARYKGIVDAGA